MRHSSKLLASFVFVSVALFFLPSIVPDFYLVSDINADQIAKISEHTFCFAVAGDTHIGFSNGSLLKWVIQDVNDKDFDFLVINGDLTHSGYKQEYEQYINIISKSGIPVISALGNHDIRNGGREHYESYFGDPNFSFKYRNKTLTVLDSSKKSISSNQYDWLENQNANILITHIPAFIPKVIVNEYSINNGEQLLKVSAETFVFSHTHERYVEDNFVFVESAGGKLTADRDSYGYTSICLDGDYSMISAPKSFSRTSSAARNL